MEPQPGLSIPTHMERVNDAVTCSLTSTGHPMIPGLSAADVLCGRDRVAHAHCGNRRFRHIIEMNRIAYQNAPCREAKTKITCQVVDMIRTWGGRFLKLNEEAAEWPDAGDS
jgi:hypothetical protein